MDSKSFAGKIVLITGATKGIGRATALHFSKLGANIVASYSSDKSSADSLVAEIGEAKCLAVKGDAGSLADIDALLKATIEKFKKIDVLIPNAGVAPMLDLASTTEADFDSAYRVNVKGPYFLAQKAAQYIPEGGHIIFISTSLCRDSGIAPRYLLYVGTKGAIEQITRVVAKDLATKGIRVNAIAPGPTGTELYYKGKSEEILKLVASRSPFQRIGTPEEIAEATAHLASNGWVAGQILGVNGSMC